MTVRTYAELADDILATPARLGDVRLVCIDGPSGSGKTTFAQRLVHSLAARGSVELVELEALYSGWSLDGAWKRLNDWVLEPVSAGWAGGFHPYDWSRGEWSPAWHSVPVSQVLVVEGCGSAPRAAQALTTRLIWVEAEPDIATMRGLARDGIVFQSQLSTWKELEAAYFRAEQTRQRADLRVDGAPSAALTHDPEVAFTTVS
ncbi:MAG: uridine kinase [Actinomycetota bacterium]|nr:uridine kinase [Actinomycetota bacterium]